MRISMVLLFLVLAIGCLYLVLTPDSLHPALPTAANPDENGTVAYFVDAVSGNDRQNGRSEATAWKTLSRLGQANLLPGTTIRLRRGQIWRETLTVHQSGTEGAPITIGAFGEGDAPSIRGSDPFDAPAHWTYEGEGLWYLTEIRRDPGMLIRDGIPALRRPSKDDLADPWNFWYDGATARLYVRADVNPAAMATTIEVPMRDVVVGPLDADFVRLEQLDLQQARECVLLAEGANALTLERCSFSLSPGDLVRIEAGSTLTSVTDCDFTEWNVDDGRGYALAATGAGSGPVDVVACTFRATRRGGGEEHSALLGDEQAWLRTVRGCSFLGNAGALADRGVVIRRPMASANRIVIDENTFRETGGSAIVVEELDYHGGTPIVSVQRNHIYDACVRDELDEDAIRAQNMPSGRASVVVAGNIIDGTAKGHHPHAGLGVVEVRGLRAVHNVIRGADDGIVLGFGVDYAFVANNILLGCRGAGIRAETGAGDIVHNAYSDNEGGPLVGVPLDPASLTEQLLLDSDLRPMPESPCIDGGVDAGLAADREGHVIPSGAAPDIGAYEYEGPRH